VAVVLRSLKLVVPSLVVLELLDKETPVELQELSSLITIMMVGIQAVALAVALVASAETQYKTLLVTGLTVV
jgi:phosphotransferase system  glucose/maltose/N-acetylglucosamine-specific IIC component